MLKLRYALICVVASVALLAIPGIASAATTYYVGAPQAATGSCTQANACTINYALSKAVSGDTVYVEHGTWVRPADDPSNPSTNLCCVYVQDGVTLVGAPGLPRPVITQNAPFTHPAGCNCGAISMLGSGQMRHLRVEQHDPAAGGAVTMQGTAKIDDSELYGEGAIGTASQFAGGHINNSLLVGKTSGLQISASFTLDQSTIVNQANASALTINSSNATGPIVVTVHNSVARNSVGTSDVYANQTGTGKTTVNFDHSATRLSGAQLLGGSIANDAGGNVADAPLFAAPPSNYRLAPGSPLIDRGLGPVAALDLDGKPFGCKPDIGAYELPPDLSSCVPAATPQVLQLSGVKLTVRAKRKKGKLSAKVTCPKTAVGSCSGTLSVKQGKKTRSAKVKAIKPGKTATIKVKAKKGKVKVTLTLTDSAGSAGSKTLSKRLK